MERRIHIPPGGPPQGAGPSREIYGLMGEAQIYHMVEDFYRELEKSSIRHMFPDDMVASSRKTADFIIGLVGGPPLYFEKYGPPRMRARHVPFVIDEAARREWLRCFERILEGAELDYGFPAEHLEGFRAFLHRFSAWMVNTA